MHPLLYRQQQRYWQVKIDSVFAWALIISVAIHLLVILFALPRFKINPLDINLHTLNVQLIPVPNSKKNPPAPVQQAPAPTPPPKKIVPQKTQPPEQTHLLSAPKSEDTVVIPQAPKPAPEKLVEKIAEKPPTPNDDLLAYLNAKRQQQRPVQEAPPSKPSEDTNVQDRLVQERKRNEIIMRNLQQDGTSGVFQIREILGSNAQFTFRGWQQDGRNSRFEIINVSAASNESIERAIIRRMIVIIREHYSGDFNWQSQRYGRVIVLSARKEDNAALEDFMLQEFFVSTGRN
jgi:hypothetical protein